MGFRWVPTARVAGDGIDTMRNWPRKTSDSTAWWTRGRVSNRSCRDYLFSETYCGGYSGEDPPLPIPNREVKLTIADGTAPPGGRVGSCHFLIRHPVIIRWRGVLLYTRVPDEDSSWSSWELTTPFSLGQAGEDSSSIINTCSSSCLYLDTMS